MKIVKKKDLATELKAAIATIEVFEGVGKESKKPYVAIKATGTNGKEVLFFLDVKDMLRLGVVVDDAE